MSATNNETIPGTDIPKPAVQLTGEDGNAFAVMGSVKQALKSAGAPKDICSEYMSKAMSGDYNHLLAVSMEYVDVE
jgi:hypothetical protein